MIRRKTGLALFLAVLGLWLANTNAFVRVPQVQSPKLIAHRGVHHIYAGADRTAETCRAAEVEPITHTLIENTLPSMRAAFDAGADVVELDVHRTPDDVFAVFHDWTLQCQTNGNGVTHTRPWAELQVLDLGHGFTADGGVTYPLRGTGLGAMRNLADVFAAELPGPVLINFKSNRRSDGKALSARLMNPSLRTQVWGVYGGEAPTQEVLATHPDLRGYDKSSLLTCLLSYQAVGWSGFVPPACRDQTIGVPINWAPYVWGWPHRFTQRMQRHGTDVILFGPYSGGGFTSGIDDLDTLSRVPSQFGGHIWTNRITLIGPAVKER